MKKKFLFLFLLIPTICFSQDLVLPSISIPGGISNQVIRGVVIEENIIGPCTVVFFGNSLQKERKKTTSIDKLSTLYSGRIYSPGIIAPFIFENKTPEELSLLEVQVFPQMLEMPYSLFVDLTIQASSKAISSGKSDEAGQYHSSISINLINGLTTKKSDSR